MEERAASLMLRALLEDHSFEDAIVAFALSQAIRYERETILHVRNGEPRQADLAAAQAGTWEKLLIEMKVFSKKYQGD